MRSPESALLVASWLALSSCADDGPTTDDAADPLAACLGRADHRPMQLVGGDQTFLALFDDGTVYCWGDNSTRQCDASTFVVVYAEPVQVAGLPCLTSVASSSTPLGVLGDRRAIAWGGLATSEPGEQGDETEVHLLPLVDVSFVYSYGDFKVAIAEEQVRWWGTSFAESSTDPVELKLGGSAERAGGNEGASCYVFGGGQVACRGRNFSGLLGVDQPDSINPVPIDLGGPVVEISADAGTACALRVDGEILCWGANYGGALGRGLPPDELPWDPVPEIILERGPFAGLAGIHGSKCAWRPSGEVLCWGNHSPFRYEGEEGFSRPPRRVPHLEPARQVAGTSDRVCALGFDDQVRCHVKELDPDVPPSAEIMVFAPPFGTQEHFDAARR